MWGRILNLCPDRPLTLPFWFEPGFDRTVRGLIEAGTFADPTTSAEIEVARWSAQLIAQGVSALTRSGSYDDGGIVEPHVWIEVEGRIFDPVAIRFWDFIHHHRREAYRADP